VPGPGPWEIEVGFGKGRFLLAGAAAHPERRYLGVEIAAEYYRRVAARLERRGLHNALVIRGEALYLLAAVLPRGFAMAVHVYFPDPWPKSRHQKRRLFDARTVDLVLGLLAPGGGLYFASDDAAYGGAVSEGREVVRLEARLAGAPAPLPPLHPWGVEAVTVGVRAAG
jgi:tRNA (guanine-N7-)-methyltransferase